MRTEKELWEVVLDHPELFYKSLCLWLIKLDLENIITVQEYKFLDQILTDEMHMVGVGYFIGPKYDLQPRIDWIKKRMEEL